MNVCVGLRYTATMCLIFRYECRDVSLKEHQKELTERFGDEDVTVPQVYAGGKWFGVRDC